MIYLTTTVGGTTRLLRPMIRYYRELGISRFRINVHLSSSDDPVMDCASQVLTEEGLVPHSVNVGAWHEIERKIYMQAREDCPDEWFVIADQDELHRYPFPLGELVGFCNSKGYDYVMGCFIDRLSADGTMVDLSEGHTLENLYPLGGFLTYPIAGANPFKVVLAKGRVRIATGQHFAINGRPCPLSKVFVQVHHFKWCKGLHEEMVNRALYHRSVGVPHWIESARIARYLKMHHNQIDISDPAFHVAPASPVYSEWRQIEQIALDAQRGIILERN